MQSAPFLVVDFETYWNSKEKYSLRKMTVHEYVHDDRFQILSVAVKPIGHDPLAVPGSQAEDLLRSLPIDRCFLVGHNLQFDGYILSQKFGLKPALYVDTMMLAMAVLGGRVKRMSLGAVYEYLTGSSGKKRGDVLLNTDGKRLEDLDEDTLRTLLRYNQDDVVETEEVFTRLIAQFPQTFEVSLLDWAVRAACWPKIQLDETLLEEELKDVRRKRRQIVKEAGVDRKVLSSNEQFVELLESLGVEVPKKVSPTTGKETYALAKTDEEFVALKDHPDERVRKIVEARLTVKSTIAETRAARLLQLAKLRRPIPAPLLYCGAVNTGRFSGAGGLNFQNLPKKGEWWDGEKWVKKTSRLRLAVKPPEGYKVIVADSSNIELRVCHYIAGETAVLTAVREGRDAYCEFASVIYGCEVNPKAYPEGSEEHERHSRMRTLGKVAMLALQYGMGAGKYQHTVKNWTGIELSDDEAQRTVSLFRQTYPRIKMLWWRLDDMLRMAAQGQTFQDVRVAYPEFPVEYYLLPGDEVELRGRLPSGFELKYPRLRVEPETQELVYWRPYKANNGREWVKIYGGLALENATQALAAMIIREQMARMMSRLEGEFGLTRDHLVLQVHDEVVLMVPEEMANDVKAMVEEEMSRSPDWAPALPLACEASVADNYGEAK